MGCSYAQGYQSGRINCHALFWLCSNLLGLFGLIVMARGELPRHAKIRTTIEVRMGASRLFADRPLLAAYRNQFEIRIAPHAVR
jgi:hypothetical protein